MPTPESHEPTLTAWDELAAPAADANDHEHPLDEPGEVLDVLAQAVSLELQAHRVNVEASSRIDIATPGEVDIRGTEMVKLNC